MFTLRTAKDHQDSEMSNMQKEISTLRKALTILAHKMVDRSSKRGGGCGYKSDGGYATDESEKENARQQNTRADTVNSTNKSLTKWRRGNLDYNI